MCEGQNAAGEDAVGLVHAYFQQISSTIQDAIDRAKQLGAEDMVQRLNSAKAAADRGSSLAGKLATIFEAERLDGNSLSSD